jgi:hypothetical protein
MLRGTTKEMAEKKKAVFEQAIMRKTKVCPETFFS